MRFPAAGTQRSDLRGVESDKHKIDHPIHPGHGCKPKDVQRESNRGIP